MLEDEKIIGGESMLEYKQAGDSPFMLIGKLKEDDEGKDYFCVIGPHRVTAIYGTEEEAIAEAMVITWAKIGAVVEASCKAYLEVHQEKV